MSSYKGESETSETKHLHGNKASCDEETYTVTHTDSSENSDEKKKSNLELLIFVDNKCR